MHRARRFAVTVRNVRCVVVGIGAISRHMLAVLATKSWYETAAFVDVRADALAEACSGSPDVPGFTDLEEALEQTHADVVIVNTPSEFHDAQATQALNAGFHVLVAKPITNDFEQAVKLVELAAGQGLTLSVGQQMRYMRHYRAVERFVRSGRLGSIEAINLLNPKPRPNPANLISMEQPALYEIACHHFDSLLAIVGDRAVESIACDGFSPSWSRYAGPCLVNAMIRFEGNLHVLYQGGFSAQAPSYELRLEGASGALRCRGLHMSVDEMTNELALPGGSFTPIDIDEGIPAESPWHTYFDVWHRYLVGGPEPSFSGRNNLKVFAPLSAGIESNERGGAPVNVAASTRYAAAFGEFEPARGG